MNGYECEPGWGYTYVVGAGFWVRQVHCRVHLIVAQDAQSTPTKGFGQDVPATAGKTAQTNRKRENDLPKTFGSGQYFSLFSIFWSFFSSIWLAIGFCG